MQNGALTDQQEATLQRARVRAETEAARDALPVPPAKPKKQAATEALA